MSARPTRHPPRHEFNPDPSIKGLPNSTETVDLLLATQDDRIRRHVGIRRPEDLSDEEYRIVYAQAHEAEYGTRPPAWDEKEPEDEDSWMVTATLLGHIDFVDGDAVARLWWWERDRWLARCHPRRARTVKRALARRRSHARGR
ncbi:MAG: hypothetical protein V3U30_06050 [Thermoplasmata archaeon]